MNLYERLGVHPGVTIHAIRQAFRKLAKKHHPDAGGDEEQFRLLEEAHRILTDPDLRAHYDATGQIGRQQPEHEDAQIYEAATRLVLGIIAQSGNVASNNIIALALERVEGDKIEMRKRIAAHKRVIENIDEVCSRLYRTDETDDNKLATLLRGRKDTMEREVNMLHEHMAVLERLGDFLAEYGYRYTATAFSLGASPTSSGGFNMFRF